MTPMTLSYISKRESLAIGAGRALQALADAERGNGAQRCRIEKMGEADATPRSHEYLQVFQ